jgi:uncharacterized membrane protein YhhN
MIFIILLQFVLFAVGAVFPDIQRPINMVISFSFVVTAFVLWVLNKYIYNKFAFFAMIFCFLGDLAMAKYIPAPNHLIVGIALFSVAHILLITGYIKTAEFNGKSLILSKLLPGIIYPILMVSVWWFIIYDPSDPVITYGILAYGMLICVMAAFALALFLTLGKSYLLTALGGIFFIISDAIIGMNVVDIFTENVDSWIWITYILALMGIIYSNTLIKGHAVKLKGASLSR